VAVTKAITAQYPNLPVYLFGHSMGSMIARCYLQEYDFLLKKVIICGSPANNPLSGLAIAITKGIILCKGDRHRSKFLAYVSTGRGNNKYKGEGRGAWLSHNRESIEWFYDNRKGKQGFTCNGFLNLFYLMKNTYTNKFYRVQNENLPILFVSGSDDQVLGSEKRWQSALSRLRKVGYQSVSGKLYEGMRHEIHNDLKKEEVLADLLAFLKE
jgi:alpha-beta hydrolase superfamily lysophospholipase